jgi:acyl-CoA thioester hydrolase
MDPFPFVCPIQVRWRDIDAFQHVNNAVYVTYLETARAALWHHLFGARRAGDIPFVIARLEIDYKSPIALYNEVEVGLRAADITAISFVFDYHIRTKSTLAAQARTVQVCVRHESGRPTRVPVEVRHQLERLL